MLNYIWLALILIGIGVAVTNDVEDLSHNRYHNGQELRVTITLSSASELPLEVAHRYACTLTLGGADLSAAYGEPAQDATLSQNAELIPTAERTANLRITLDGNTPAFWKQLANLQKNGEILLGKVRWDSAATPLFSGLVTFDPVKFVNLNAVTNDGLIRYAKTAVELAIGLIGIMALWLGLMRIAEQSGLIRQIANALRPVTTRLFPDVPADHPAMGAMIMNISANMLGLANAATPLGLKAMEELNKLTTKAGTATDAMCTFLVINTSNVQIIPATVIAIRAAAGSVNPTEIIGPVIVATTVSTIAGVLTVKFLARLPLFRRQLQPGGDA